MQDVKVDYKNIAEERVKKELVDRYGRLAVPTLIIGKKVILGFEQNKEEIIKDLGLKA